MDIVFPPLRPVVRDREYRSVPEQQRDKIVYSYLFEGKSHRWLDEKIIETDASHSRGWLAMGVLHHIGIGSEHKGTFKGFSIEEAIASLLRQSKTEFKGIIAMMIRFSEEIYCDDGLDFFHITDESLKLIKNIETSQYTDGVRIEKSFHAVFNSPTSPYYTQRGESRAIMVLFNNKIFDAEYRYEDQNDTTLQLQSIRFKKELKREFKKVFPDPQGRFFIQCGRDVNHFIFTIEPIIITNDNDDDLEEEYSEGDEAFRLHRVRERNPKVVRKAKDRFFKKYGRLYCEVCGFDFRVVYGKRGASYIEGHHTKFISDMAQGEKTKVEDIALLCSNCHRMIHVKPIVSVGELAELIKMDV